MRKLVCTLPFAYERTTERLVLNLEQDGLPCVPALGYSHFKRKRPTVSVHQHPGCIEITICLRGSLIFESEENSYNLLPGNVFVTKPDERHRLLTNLKGLVMYWMLFRPSVKGRNLLKLPVDESDALREMLLSLPHKIFKSSERLRISFQRLFKAHAELKPGALRTLSMRSALFELLLALAEAAHEQPVEQEAEHRLLQLIEAMRRNPEEDYPAELLMRSSALSESSLNTRFKELTGLPPYTFLLNCRLQQARKFLQQSNQSVTQIAQTLKFSSSQHFAMQFKREFGVTPSQCRAQGNSLNIK
jgi:AraC-like DNA-binding protein